MIHYEQNPIGIYLIQLDNGDVSFFIFLKVLGTFVVIGTLYMLRKYKSVWSYIIASILTILQCILLAYLYITSKYLDILYDILRV